MQKGKASIKFDEEPVIMGAASIVGEKEGEGPLKSLFRQGGAGSDVRTG